MSKKHIPRQVTPILLSLDKRHVELLSDFVIEVRRLGVGANASATERALAEVVRSSEARREVLVGLLHRSLGDPSYFSLWLEAVRMALPELLPYEELSDETFNQIVNQGAGELNVGKAAYLALSPDQMQVIADEIVEKMPWFWVERVEEAMTLAAQETGEHRRTTDELLDEVQVRLARRYSAAREKEPSLESAFGAPLDSQPSKGKNSPIELIGDAISARLRISAGTGYWSKLEGLGFHLEGSLTTHVKGMILRLPGATIDFSTIRWLTHSEVVASTNELHFIEAIELPLKLTGKREDEHGRLVVELSIERT